MQADTSIYKPKPLHYSCTLLGGASVSLKIQFAPKEISGSLYWSRNALCWTQPCRGPNFCNPSLKEAPGSGSTVLKVQLERDCEDPSHTPTVFSRTPSRHCWRRPPSRRRSVGFLQQSLIMYWLLTRYLCTWTCLRTLYCLLALMSTILPWPELSTSSQDENCCQDRTDMIHQRPTPDS